MDEGSLCRAKRLKFRCEKSQGITRAESAHEYKDQEGIAEDFQKDSVVFGPPSLDKWMLFIETCIRRTPCIKRTLEHSPRVSV